MPQLFVVVALFLRVKFIEIYYFQPKFCFLVSSILTIQPFPDNTV